MSWFDRIVIGVIGGGVAFVLWLVQRHISRAAENEAVDRLTKKLDMLDGLNRLGLPHANLARSVAHEVRTLSAATNKRCSPPQDFTRIVGAMRVAAESRATKIATPDELESLHQERADTYEELISLLLSSANMFEGMAHVGDYDAFFDLLACYHRAKAMRTTALIEASGVRLGSGGIASAVFSVEELEQKARHILREGDGDEMAAKEVEDFRSFTLSEIAACKSARAKLEGHGESPHPAR